MAEAVTRTAQRAGDYVRRRPESSALYELVRDNQTLYGAIDDGALDVRLPKHAKKDTLRVEGRCLLRSFPVYGDQDPNAHASGGTRELCYRLERGEASFVLVPQLERAPE